MKTRLLTLAAALVLAGCGNLAPDYQRPAAPIPEGWKAGSQPVAEAVPTAAPALAWRTFITDERLRQVVAQALDSNRDLKVAALNIDRARAQYNIQRANLLPTINATGTASRTRTPADLTTNNRATTLNQFGASVGLASYELDFFGRVRNLNDAALEAYLSLDETRRSVQISLISDTVNAWLTLAADQRRLRLAQETLRSQQASYDLTVKARDIGNESGLTLAQARTTVDSARSDVAAYSRAVAQDRNLLTLLVGSAVSDTLLPSIDEGLKPVTALVNVPDGLPSDLLQGRPDVLAAEHTLQSANANIGAARAAFFPRITLTASGGTGTRDLSNLFDSGNGAWSFAPQIVLPIFSGGALRASLDVARITRDINVAQYDKAVQTAFREVSDALDARATLGEQLDAQRSLRDASAQAYRLSQERYRTGVDSYLDTLVTQRSLYAAGQTLITLELAEQSNRLALYKTMGGGWQ
ncbi:efflux transporter outer membrane subunit [Xylophilus rhododendri]|uniref:Efflux transporter outer membrane subunit n=1 Tax=Xylophilus rhododendri TaxID=2697032 RepID=A0A857J4V5_9BURK|nr:efflux transporter outer membrane subunit [Xylophilus rhododendri]QHI98243.1 efflux transporter outer membrane subunit [Xylophilus rhododendri]